MRESNGRIPQSGAYDALIISDIHLGAAVCQVEPLLEFLHAIAEDRVQTRELVLNGDVFDSIDFRRLRKQHWKVLSMLRKLSHKCRIVWVCGNHDGPAEIVSHLLGVEVKDEHILTSPDGPTLVLHGHTFDDFIDEHPLITAAADFAYRTLQLLDRSHTMARHAKYGSKTFLRCVTKVRDGATAYAALRGFGAVCCGHTHHASIEEHLGVKYYNSGCWTERPCTLLTLRDGAMQLTTYDEFRESFASTGQLLLFDADATRAA